MKWTVAGLYVASRAGVGDQRVAAFLGQDPVALERFVTLCDSSERARVVFGRNIEDLKMSEKCTNLSYQ